MNPALFVLLAVLGMLLGLLMLAGSLLAGYDMWSQLSATTKTVYHQNEYALETAYALQLTPMIKLQPDFQVVWNPAHNPNADHALVFQLQLVMAW